MASTNAVTFVTVEIRRDGDLYHAFSDDVFGLYLTGRSQESLERDVSTACKYLFRKNRKVEIQVSPVSERKTFPDPVFVPGKYAIGYNSQAAAVA